MTDPLSTTSRRLPANRRQYIEKRAAEAYERGEPITECPFDSWRAYAERKAWLAGWTGAYEAARKSKSLRAADIHCTKRDPQAVGSPHYRRRSGPELGASMPNGPRRSEGALWYCGCST